MNSRPARLGAFLLASALVLSACGLGDDKDDSKKEKTSESAAPTAEGTPAVGDNGFTTWGADLEFGETARVPWSPKQKLKGAVEITLKRVEQAPMKSFEGFKLTAEQKKGTAYYVRAKVENVGNADLSGFTLPVYLDDGSDVIYPPVNIPSSFKPCDNRELPKKFIPGKKAQVCMVFLSAPGTQMKAIALQPAEGIDQIEWTGAVSELGKAKQGKNKKKAKKSN
ncbi:hypothetical protein [Nocardioides alcanivorans]|uniref:hypothetical protein n=1 Tax=Nocardioides alcanivorans TaxID=2897352 RepID=UPI001F1F12F5|nr:hypothetical protein [Nocardioides alcanivorans]